MRGTPVRGKVAVEIDASDGVFVEASVLIVVDALRIDFVVRSIRLPRRPADHPAWVVVRNLPRSIRVDYAHPQNASIQIEIFGRILVDRSVPILVDRTDIPAVVFRRVHGYGTTVGIDEGHHVEHTRVDEPCDVVVHTVLRQQMVNEIESRFAAEDLSPVDIAVEIERRFFAGRTRFGIVDLDGENGPTAAAQPDHSQLGDVRVTVDYCLEIILKLLDGVVLVERDECSSNGSRFSRAARKHAAEKNDGQLPAYSRHDSSISVVCSHHNLITVAASSPPSPSTPRRS